MVKTIRPVLLKVQIVLITFSLPSVADQLVISTVVVPTAQPFTTQANSVNDSGQVVGSFQDQGGTFHGFLRSADGQNITTFDVPGSFYTNPQGINNKGEIIGIYATSPSSSAVFVRSTDGSTYTTVSILGASGLEIYRLSINSTDQITGFLRQNGQFYSFMCNNPLSCVLLAISGADTTMAEAINDRGQIVGSIAVGGQTHAFLLNPDNSVVVFDEPNATIGTTATGIANSGQIVGYYYGITGLQDFARSADGDTFLSFNDPSALPGNTFATSVNSNLIIVGYSLPSFNHYQGFWAVLSGDLNGDGVVNCADLTIVMAAFGTRAGQPNFASSADLNLDGVVDIKDVAILSRQLSTGIQCAPSVPIYRRSPPR